jgi:hypothetical protein
MVESLDSRLESNKEEKKKRARARQIETERGLMGWGFGLGVLGLVFGDWGSWFKVQGSGFRLRVWGLGLVTFSSFACSSTICF